MVKIINNLIQAVPDQMNKPITGVGVVFSTETKGVADWDKEEL